MKIAVSAAFILAATLQPGWSQTLTARQVFLRPDGDSTPAPAAKKAAVKKKSAAPAPKTDVPPPAAPVAEGTVSPPPRAPAPHVSTAAYIAPHPLALRYKLVRVSHGVESEVSPRSTFHSGDTVRVKVEGSRDGYLYVIARGSSGVWKPLFPAPGINAGNNRIAAYQSYTLPSARQVFTFDERAGEERLFVIYSAEPIADVEGVISSLPQAPKTQTPKPEGAGPEVFAMNTPPITDAFVSGMQQTYSRDLLVETVDQQTPAETSAGTGASPENAVYVANPSGGRVVADIRLEHQ